MKLDIYLNRASNVFAENRLLKVSLIILLIITIFNSYMLSRALTYQRTVIIPAGFNEKVELKGDSADDAYLRTFTRYVVNLMFSYSHATARAQFSELLLLYAPEAFPLASKAFYRLADEIETARVSSVFYIHSILTDHGKKVIEVKGTEMKFIEDKKLESAPKEYLISYRVQNGTFQLLDVKEKTGGEK